MARYDFPISPDEAPRAWTLPGEHLPSPPPWRSRLSLLDDLPAGTIVDLDGGDPLCLPGLHDLLDELDRRGLRAALHTDLPTLDDDGPLRRFAPHDVRFVVRFPTSDATRFASLTGHPFDRFEHALRNVRAFAYPIVIEVPVSAATAGDLEATLAYVLAEHSVTGADVRVVRGEHPSDAAWDASPTWEDVAAALLALDARSVKPRPRLYVTGIPALALPLDAITRLDLVVQGAPDDRWVVPDGYRRVHGEPSRPDPDTLARRRTWLALPAKERPGFRGDPRDRLVDATSAVLVRPGHPVHVLVMPRRDELPAIATSERHGLYAAGRFTDAALAARFATLAAMVRDRAAEHPPDLATLRAFSQVLRRGMKPSNDDAPVAWREEGQ